MELFFIRLSRVHLIGYSLGGRVTGMVRHRLRTNQTIAKITGDLFKKDKLLIDCYFLILHNIKSSELLMITFQLYNQVIKRKQLAY